MKVLIVDDSALIRTALMRLVGGLKDAGPFTVLLAGTQVAALECACREQPAFTVLDFHLPDGNAPQLIGKLKQSVPHMVIAVFTMCPSEWYAPSCLRAGADWFLDKTSDVNQLLDLMVRHAAPANTSRQAADRQS